MKIDEAVCLLESKGYKIINEMSYDRQKIQDTFFNYLDNIIQNYCLIRYVSTCKDHSENLNHWKVELRALLLKLNKMKIRSGDKEKALIEEYEKAEYSLQDIVDIIETKFEIENINADLKNLALSFKTNAYDMISIVANGDKQDIIDFIEGI